MSTPVSTHTVESALIPAPVGKVWELISSLNFGWWNLVESTQLKDGLSAQTLDSTLVIKFKDGQSWEIQVVELSSLRDSLSFQVISDISSIVLFFITFYRRLLVLNHLHRILLQFIRYL